MAKPIILTVGMQKGGVGKTTIAVHLAGFLAKYGYKTLLVDMDGQASATSFFFKEPLAPEKTLAILFDQDEQIITQNGAIILKTQYENLYIAPSCIAMVSAEAGHFELEPTRRLYYWIQNSCQDFDYIIIDTPPALGRLTGNVLMVADYILLPCLPEPQSVDAIPNYLKNFARIRSIRPHVKVLGIIVNNFSKKESAHNFYLSTLEATGKILGVIRHTTLFVNLSHEKRLLAYADVVKRQQPRYDEFENIVQTVIKLIKE